MFSLHANHCSTSCEYAAEEAEVDEMWSFVKKKSNQRWLWHAIDHASGKVLAYVFGARKDNIFSQLKELLVPFGISYFLGRLPDVQ